MADLFEAYVAGEAGAFFAGSPADVRARQQATLRAARPLAPRVLAALRSQNARFGPSTAREAQLDALAAGAAAVVTGQQVGLFLGPLYTIYKTASAIAVARALAAESGQPVVPIFWLQTEDHDLVEIASSLVPRADQGPLTLSLPVAPDNRISVAHLSLPDGIAGCLAALESELTELPHAGDHLGRLGRHYRPGAAWGEAFAGVLAELFEPEGLVLCDPRDPALAREVVPLHARALSEALPLGQQLAQRAEALSAAGFAPTVRVRADSPLSFVHPAGPAGPRYRLKVSTGGFELPGTDHQHTLQELTALLEREPLAFSTSALLRPIIQDSLLPTAAYVGGPAEVAYFAQLAPLYAAFELAQPLVVPRARFRLLEPSARRLLTRHGLLARDAEQPEPALLSQLASRSGEESPALSPRELERALREGFEATLGATLERITPLGAALAGQIDKTRDKLRLTSTKLAERYEAALLRRDSARVADVQRLQQLLCPGGVPQERCYGVSYYAARYGERELIEQLLAAIDPFAAAKQELYL